MYVVFTSSGRLCWGALSSCSGHPHRATRCREELSAAREHGQQYESALRKVERSVTVRAAWTGSGS